MKNYILAIVATTMAITCFAQVTDPEKKLRESATDTILGWKTGGVISLNASQVSLTNWAAGGQNSIAGNGLISLFANHRGKSHAWDNSLDVGYGVLQQGKSGKPIKTDDKIDLLSKYGKDAFGKWYYAALASFKTQMTPGYNYPNDSVTISDWLAPAYFLGALGMDYKPSEKLGIFIAPVTGKITVVSSQVLANAGSFGVEPAVTDSTGKIITPGKRSRMEFGGYMRAIYKTNLMENISLTTKLDLFSNYLEKPENIDVNWEVLISMKINKYISATLSTQLIYDDDVDILISETTGETGPRIQFKEVFGVGFSYKF